MASTPEPDASLDTVLYTTQCFQVTPLYPEPASSSPPLPPELLQTLRNELDDVVIINPAEAAATRTTTKTTTTTTTTGKDGQVQIEVSRTLSVRVRAGEYRPVVERFYAGLENGRSPEPVHAFAVLVGRNRRPRRLTLDLAAGAITRHTRRGRRAKTHIAFRDVVQVLLSAQDPLLVHLRLRSGVTGFLRLTTMADRARFYALCWAGQCAARPAPVRGVRATADTLPVSVFVGTFNAHGAAPAGLPDAWLTAAGATTHDVVAVCAQECGGAAFDALVAPLARTHVVVARDGLRRVRLAVLVRARLARLVRAVEHAHFATGAAGLVGTKGAAAVALALGDTRLCVVGCHLAAHEHGGATRNAQYAAVVRALRLGHARADVLSQYDHVLWCGDLNYRVALPAAQSIAFIRARQNDALLAHDQLTRVRREKLAFVDFAEATINFAPTYKIAPGLYSPSARSSSRSSSTKVKDSSSASDNKTEGEYIAKRNPSWCDRVLWKSSPAAVPLTPAVYTASSVSAASDHRPVHAVLRTRILLPPAPALCVPLTLSFRGPLAVTDLVWPEEYKRVSARTSGSATAATSPVITLTFFAPFLDPTKTYASHGKPPTECPTWEEGEVADLPTCLCDPLYLSRRCVTAVLSLVYPRVTATLGRALIPLGLGAEARPTFAEGVSFATHLTRHGLPVGKLSGTVCIFPTPDGDSVS